MSSLSESPKFSVYRYVFGDFVCSFNLPLAEELIAVLEKHIEEVEAKGKKVDSALYAFYEEIDNRAQWLCKAGKEEGSLHQNAYTERFDRDLGRKVDRIEGYRPEEDRKPRKILRGS
jgi:hypothetical protein